MGKLRHGTSLAMSVPCPAHPRGAPAPVGHTWVGHPAFGHQLSQEDAKGPDVRLDGEPPKKRSLRSCPLDGELGTCKGRQLSHGWGCTYTWSTPHLGHPQLGTPHSWGHPTAGTSQPGAPSPEAPCTEGVLHPGYPERGAPCTGETQHPSNPLPGQLPHGTPSTRGTLHWGHTAPGVPIPWGIHQWKYPRPGAPLLWDTHTLV